ncbi:uncharacterized protein LOC117579448 [Drosophila guanche]|uniref:uncharacterized protein LOC117579448 n=1 Tax=Drosophila guanche TaxID=7266 RepID=UPI0014718E75|nr:uncharacterized protein LOC117579448 [Drosophila guanche]
MTKLIPILFACYIRLFSNLSVFVLEEEDERCQHQTRFGSLIFFLSMMDVLHGIEVLPKKMYRKSRLFKMLLDTICVLIISEITMMFFWVKLEVTIDMVLPLILETNDHRLVLLEAITVGLSVFSWAMVSPATHKQCGLFSFLSRSSRMIQEAFKELAGHCGNLIKAGKQPKAGATRIKGILKSSRNKSKLN